MAPKSTAGKIAAVTYIVACTAVLALAISGRDIRDTDIVVAYAMLLLSFPIGYVVALLFGAIGSIFEGLLGVIVPGGVGNNVVVILAFGTAGYAQWFLAVPWLYKRMKVPSNNALERTGTDHGSK